MMLPHSTHEIVPLMVEHVLDSLVGGIALCAVAWTWLRVAGRQNSASRFFILFILLIGIAVLPFAGISFVMRSDGSGFPGTHSLITLPADSAEYLFLAWAVISAALLTRVAAGFVQLQRLKKRCTAVELTTLDSTVRLALQSCTRRVELCVSDRVNVPTALGLASPVKIVIPAWLMNQISPAELHHLVLHEVAHLRRWDDWTNFAQRLLGAMFFFHPAVWWLERRISLEREMACDESVLAETGDARGYAKSLANMAQRSFVRRSVALAQSAVSRLHDTTLRVAKILAPAPRKANSTIGMIASGAALGGFAVAVALYSPDLVGFSETQQHDTLRASNSAEFFAPVPKPTLASMKLSEPVQKHVPAPEKHTRSTQRVTPRAIEHETLARTEKPSLFVPAKATRDQATTLGQPAVLVVYQEMVSSDGSVIMVQQTLWHVVLRQPITRKEPARTT
jgi:beta-lactamase regulating signal transducer with metallopeptidase domain